MNEVLHAEFDSVLHPGEHVRDFLEAQQLSQAEFAARAGLSEKHVSQIIGGKAGITAEVALALERIVGGGAAMWLNLDSAYRLWKTQCEDGRRLQEWVQWASDFPLADLRRRGVIRSKRVGTDTVRELLLFFGLAHPRQWESVYGAHDARYRQSPAFVASEKAQITWLRLCELRAEVYSLPPFDRKGFETALLTVRGRLSEPPMELFDDAQRLLAQCGVALVAEPGVDKARLSGAAFWPRRNKAVLGLTGRFKTADHLWFSFFHEAGHIMLHRDRNVLEVDGNSGDLEREADHFARAMLLPSHAYEELIAKGAPSPAEIERTAVECALPVDSLIGMLQHDGLLPHTAGRELRRPISIPRT